MKFIFWNFCNFISSLANYVASYKFFCRCTPKYLYVATIDTPAIAFWCSSQLLSIDYPAKNMTPHLFLFSVMKFLAHHCSTVEMRRCTRASPCAITVTSSAQRNAWQPSPSSRSDRSSIQRLKRSGDRIPPCRTPRRIGTAFVSEKVGDVCAFAYRNYIVLPIAAGILARLNLS